MCQNLDDSHVIKVYHALHPLFWERDNNYPSVSTRLEVRSCTYSRKIDQQQVLAEMENIYVDDKLKCPW